MTLFLANTFSDRAPLGLVSFAFIAFFFLLSHHPALRHNPRFKRRHRVDTWKGALPRPIKKSKPKSSS